jgi:ABC-2 type transport system ATP-binding protein
VSGGRRSERALELDAPAARGAAEAARGEPALAIRGLEKSFPGHLGLGRTPAVTGLDLEVARGEIFGLLGPNGAGKTTTIKLIVGLLRADRGEVRLLGRPPSDVATRARIGYLPENPYFYDHLKAEEFLDFYARLQGIGAAERPARIAAALGRVGLAGRARVALRKFSKGMVQRVGLAQAIQHDPEFVILDEPMSGLDPVGRRDVRNLILELRTAGRTVLFSSHILQDAEMICDRVAILDRGRLRTAGRLEDLVSRGVEWYEVAVRGVRAERLPAPLVAAGGAQCVLRVADAGALGELLSAVKVQGGEVLAVWPKRKTLEDLFMEQLPAQAGRGAP